jgi:cell division protease FtsH
MNNKLPGNKLPNLGKYEFIKQFASTVAIFLIMIFAYQYFFEAPMKKQEIGISDVARKVELGEVKSLEILNDKLTIITKDGTKLYSKKDSTSSIEQTLANFGVTKDQLQNIEIKVDSDSGIWAFVFNILPFLLPVGLIFFFFYMMSKQMGGAGAQALSFGMSKARIIDPKDTKQKVMFKDVAGAKEAKQELMEIVDFLKNPQKFIDIGAQIPKGVILMGPPGTGKTMLARAVAGEAGVPFFHLSGSEFIEMFVGVGASRVRDLFGMAKKAAPSIIFIDEVDAIGRLRGTGMGGGNDEREQTLNQILVEMDGFEPNEKVIVMAATNRPDVLDPALVRPGRFDRRVTLDLPDRKDREDILVVQSTTKPFEENVNLKIVAERTPGFSGADLYSLMNESAILAARESRKKVSQDDILKSIEKVMLGPERKSHVMNDREKILTAYHEAGHALVGAVLPNADPVHKISIISRGHAGGYTLSLPNEDKKLHSKKVFIDEIAMTYGGYAAEELIYGDVTTGPSSDLQQATLKARDMVVRYGMSELVGPRAVEMQPNKRRVYTETSSEVSPELAKNVDSEIEKIAREGLNTARKIVKEYREVLEYIKDELIKVENIEREEFEKILTKFNIPLKV